MHVYLYIEIDIFTVHLFDYCFRDSMICKDFYRYKHVYMAMYQSNEGKQLIKYNIYRMYIICRRATCHHQRQGQSNSHHRPAGDRYEASK